ncbi:MAG TPA: AAA family ATPase [bacterium]|nr:AAA family ATPase [bacterium]
MLTHIEIRGYRSLKDVRLDMEPLNVLIGPNGCGKSNFMDVFALLKQAARGGLSEGIERRGGIASIQHRGGEIGLAFRLDFGSRELVAPSILCISYAVSVKARGTFPIVQAEEMWVPGWEPENPDEPESGGLETIEEMIMSRTSDKPNQAVLYMGPDGCPDVPPPQIKELESESELAIFQVKDRAAYWRQYVILQTLENWMVYPPIDIGAQTKIRQPETIRPGFRVFSNCSNAVAVLHAVSQTNKTVWAEMLDVLRVAYPELDDIRFPPEGGDGKVNLRWFEKPFENEAGFSAEYLSDGTVRMLALVAILMTPDPPPLICIDEPEIGLHPELVELVAELLQSAATRTQVIVATHSPELVSKLKPNEVIVVEKEDGATVMERLSEEELAVWLDKFRLGDLWTSGHIGGRP